MGERGPPGGEHGAWRDRRARIPTPTRPTDAGGPGPATDEFVPERWVRTDDRHRGAARSEKPRPPAHRPVPAPAELPPDVANELASAAGPDWSHLRDRMTERMAAGIGAYERERYRDASRILKTVVDAVPNAPSARELLGLSQYHQGYWKAALPNLEAFAALTGSVDQHPVRMDCQRALGRPKRVEALFTELRQGSPDPEVLSEGRLVLAGTRADHGDLAGAVALLVEAGAGRLVRNPAERHLRQWYVLGDLMERSGDLAKARELFLRVSAADPDAYDVAERLESLGPPARARRRPAEPAARRPLGSAAMTSNNCSATRPTRCSTTWPRRSRPSTCTSPGPTTSTGSSSTRTARRPCCATSARCTTPAAWPAPATSRSCRSTRASSTRPRPASPSSRPTSTRPSSATWPSPATATPSPPPSADSASCRGATPTGSRSS